MEKHSQVLCILSYLTFFFLWANMFKMHLKKHTHFKNVQIHNILGSSFKIEILSIRIKFKSFNFLFDKVSKYSNRCSMTHIRPQWYIWDLEELSLRKSLIIAEGVFGPAPPKPFVLKPDISELLQTRLAPPAGKK